MIQYSIEYASWLVLQVPGEFYTFHYVGAYLLTLLLQALRRQLSAPRYLLVWQVLMVIALSWGGWGLLRYLPNWLHWYEAYFFLPCLAACVGLAKLHERLRGKIYWSLMATIFLVLVTAHVVMAPYRTNLKSNPWNRPPLTGVMHDYLTDKGWGGWTRNGDIAWMFFDSWGVAFLAGVAVVWPRQHKASQYL